MRGEKPVEVGKIVAPHGVRGEVRVVQLSEFPDKVAALKEVEVAGQGRLEVTAARFHKQFILMKFAGVDSIEQAEQLKNKSLFVSREELGPLPEGRYYIEDMLGMLVVDTAGEELGHLFEVLPTGSNDVYVVKKTGAKDILLPAIKQVVKDIDIKNKKMLVDPPVWEDDK